MEQEEMSRRIIALEKEVKRLREDFEDAILSEEDIKAIKDAEEDEREEPLVSAEELKRELGL